MQTIIDVPEAQEHVLATRTRSLVLDANSYAVIRSDTQRDEAFALASQIRGVRDLIAEFLDDSIAKAYSLHRTLTGKRSSLDGPLADAETKIKRGIGTYEAAKRADVEAMRRTEEQEQRRLAEEAELKRQREIERLRRDAEDARLAEAVRLEAEGKAAQAEQLLAAPVHVVAPPVAPPPPIVNRTAAYKPPEAVSTRVTWKARIVNAGLVPLAWCIPDEKRISAHARTMGAKASPIPGVEYYSEAIASLR